MGQQTPEDTWYHAVADFGNQKRHWWNRPRDLFLKEVLFPLISKQVVSVHRRGTSWLFNFGSVSYVEIIKSKKKLKRQAPGKIPRELRDQDFLAANSATEEFVDEIKLIQASPQFRSLLQRSLDKPKKQIFVIMKFGDDELDSAYDGIKDIGKEFGFSVTRVDEIQDSGNISEQMLENISQSELILAELTGARPNCYYEAGFAHALGKDLIFCIRKGESIHFDLAGYRFIEWTTEADLRKKLRARLDAYASKDSD